MEKLEQIWERSKRDVGTPRRMSEEAEKVEKEETANEPCPYEG